MPPLGAALVAGIGAAFGGGGALVGTNLLAGLALKATISSFAVKAFTQLAAGVALSALSAAIQKKPGVQGTRGTRVTMEAGEDKPLSFILGRHVTAGDLDYVGSRGSPGDTPNEHLTQVIELADWPAQLRRCWINGEWVTLRATPHPTNMRGRGVVGYARKGNDRLFVNYYDGTQTSADPYLVSRFGGDAQEPWTSDMIGRGLAYAVVTAGWKDDVHRGPPQCRFELDGLHYDPRRDSTAGGSGAQRWGSPSTWQPSTNPVVLIYNVMRGIHDPVTGVFVWGGGFAASDFPAAVWFAAMNACDVTVATDGGTEARYRAGMEVRVDEEPASIIEELLKACEGRIADLGTHWHITVGEPTAPVVAFSADDVIVTEPATYEPFEALDQTYNGVATRYVEPESGWESKDAPLRHKSTYEAEDGGRRQIADLALPAVFSGQQAQRLADAGLKDHRRMRRNVMVLPPDFRPLAPLDEVAFTDPRNGYLNKLFSVELVEDLLNGCKLVALRERDPDDYDFDPGDYLPSPVAPGIRPPTVPVPTIGFSVEGLAIKDNAGADRRPAIRLNWDPDIGDQVRRVLYRVRLRDVAQVPTKGLTDTSGDPGEAVAWLFNGEPVTFNGEPVTFGSTAEVGAGAVFITQGILALTWYEVQAAYDYGRDPDWSEWMEVQTPEILLTESDFAEEVRDKIQEAADNAAAAREDVLDVISRVDDVEDLVGGLSSEVLDQLAQLVEDLGGLTTGDILELRGIALAGLNRGWAKDPTFDAWTGSSLDHWTGTGIATYGEKVPGFYPSALSIDVGSGAAVVNVRAASDETGQLPGADPAAEYVVVSVMLRGLSGSLAGGRLRAEWKASGSGDWTRGHAFGASNSLGRLVEDWGFAVDPDRLQSREVIWRRPVGADADAVSLIFWAKQSSPTDAVEVRVDYLDIRAASEAEVAGYLANDNADAKITAFAATITGPAGAIAVSQDVLRAEFGPQIAGVTSTALAAVSAVDALAGKVDTVEASIGGNNLVKNPAFRLDGSTLGQGVAPKYWTGWPSGFRVIARDQGSGTNAIRTSPAPFMVQVSADEAQHQATAVDRFDVKPGDRVSVSLAAAGGGSGSINFQLQARMTWRDADNAVVGSVNVRGLNVTGTGWVQSDFTEFVAPADAAMGSLAIRRSAGGSAHPGYFTQVECRIVDNVAYAAATQALVASANANASIASINTTVAASFGNFSSFVSQTASAVATAEGAATALVFRTIGGSIGLYGWDNLTGTGAAIKLDAANVIAPGTLSAGELVIMDHDFNMVPDPQLQSQTAWIPQGNGNAGWQVIPDTSANLTNSQGEVRWNYVSGASLAVCGGPEFPVRPGQVLTCSFQVGRIGGTGYTARAQIRFTSRDGSTVEFRNVDTITTTSTATQNGAGTITVPSDMRRARWRWIVDSAAANTNVRFWAPSVIRRSDASVLITPDGAFMSTLTAWEAWIGEANIIDLSVSKLKILDGAVGRLYGAANNSNSNVGNPSEETILSVTIPSGVSGRGFVIVNTGYRPSSVDDLEVTHRIRQNGTARLTRVIEYGGSTDWKMPGWSVGITVAPGDVITFSLHRTSGSGSGQIGHRFTDLGVFVSQR